MKMMQGAFSRADLNMSRTRAAPTPTNTWTNSEPDTEINGTPASPATALASNVLPVPGGPLSKHPDGILAPISVYLSGFFKKSTTSSNSSFALSHPATSAKLVFVTGVRSIFALDFANASGSSPPGPRPPLPPPPPPPKSPPGPRPPPPRPPVGVLVFAFSRSSLEGKRSLKVG